MKNLVLLTLLLLSVTMYGQDFEIGKKIFTENCSSCHKMEQKLVGPPLQNVIGEQGRDWTREWIRNPQKLIASGDKHANDVYNEYNKMAMPAYGGLISDEELESLLTYLEDYKVNKEEEVVDTSSSSTTTTQSSNPPSLPLSLLIMVGVVVFLFFITIFILVWIVKLLTSSILKEDSINNFLMIKLGTDSKKVKKEFDEYLRVHSQKQVKEVVSKFKKEFNDKLKEF